LLVLRPHARGSRRPRSEKIRSCKVAARESWPKKSRGLPHSRSRIADWQRPNEDPAPRVFGRKPALRVPGPGFNQAEISSTRWLCLPLLPIPRAHPSPVVSDPWTCHRGQGAELEHSKTHTQTLIFEQLRRQNLELPPDQSRNLLFCGRASEKT